MWTDGQTDESADSRWRTLLNTYLWVRVVQIDVARIQVLHHDDEGQEVGGGEIAGITTGEDGGMR